MISGWREGVVSFLTTEFADAEVVSGERDGRWQGESDLIAVWWPGWEQLTRDVMLAAPTLTLRYFPAVSKQPTTDTPADPSALEDAADALIAAFDRASQAVGFFTANLSCRLASLRADYRPDVWRLEGSLIAYTLSEGA